MALGEFITGNRKTARRAGEILTAVMVPRTLEGAASTFSKLGARRYLVISISMVAAVVQADVGGLIAEARVAIGSCSATAKRLRDLESDLAGKPISEAAALVRPEHLAPLSPIDDLRATAEYRRDSSLTLVRRTLQACAGRA
jgi:CO/xanthine dehydrogenase FAD-binding subunit